MEELQSSYETLHNDLQSFLNELITKLKPDAPSELQHLIIIADIIQVGDPEFLDSSGDDAHKKILLVDRLTNFVIDNAEHFVDSDNLDWYKEKTDLLKVWMTLVDAHLVNVQLTDDDTNLEDMSAGIGGFNTKTSSHREINVENLKAAMNALQASGS
ncbi:hypothetical protein PoB_007680400 [Plakobranchus ocellatus]|uniref:Uncharacterized protein n=1 Tax=Plakobranchus ocellatus TaxID=259542 RepID=A0AAV4E1Z2_9GAST|nr:hypothetical protein PoB_007680400 [Plakobranchus ocellatus]